MSDILLDIRGLKKHFVVQSGFLSGRRGTVKAVDGIGMQIVRGETLGLVGESGCGKTTLGRLIMRLEEPTSGSILFEGTDVLSQRGKSLKRYRREVQMIFQDPYSSLNPRQTTGGIIGEPLQVHYPERREERKRKMSELMGIVGLNEEQLTRYPHEFSGGQRQRIGIARALILNPKLIIADEPVSALDVSIQAQILNLMKRLQQEFSLTYLFITHDLGVVRHMSDRIAVMYLGKIVELSTAEGICRSPAHPYTRALISAVPVIDPSRKVQRMILHGELPSAAAPRGGVPSTRAVHPGLKRVRIANLCWNNGAPVIGWRATGRFHRDGMHEEHTVINGIVNISYVKKCLQFEKFDATETYPPCLDLINRWYRII